jgi:hypothetical protein
LYNVFVQRGGKVQASRYKIRMPMASWFGARLADVLGRLAEETSDVNLARILKMDRRRVRALRSGHSGATMSLFEIDLLDRFLHAEGRGGILGLVSAKPTVFQSLARCSDICFLLGSRNRNDVEHVSLYDFKAAMSLQEMLTQARTSSQLPPQVFNTQTCLVNGRKSASIPAGGSPRATAWLSFGAPISNPFAEVLLRGMLSGWKQPPFALVFPDAPRPSSQFIKHEPKRKYRGVGFLGESPWIGDANKSYGLVVAQEHPQCHVRVAFLGATGASTMGAVRVLAELSHEIPTSDEKVLVAVAEVTRRRAPGEEAAPDTVKLVAERLISREPAKAT